MTAKLHQSRQSDAWVSPRRRRQPEDIKDDLLTMSEITEGNATRPGQGRQWGLDGGASAALTLIDNYRYATFTRSGE